jgi:hypothetical protein
MTVPGIPSYCFLALIRLRAGNYKNPGLTGGLRGRKRDATEGGTREIGLVEYPPAVKANRVESRYPIQTTDIMVCCGELSVALRTIGANSSWCMVLPGDNARYSGPRFLRTTTSRRNVAAPYTTRRHY